MSSSPLTSIADLENGATVRVEGVVRVAGERLRSPLMGRECVYWDVRRGLRDAPERAEGASFWIEDSSGELLVRGQALSVDVRARRSREILTTVAADTKAVGERLRKLKDEHKSATGDVAKELRAERLRLAKLATFLHAVRAQARGKLHLGGKTLEEQERWIDHNAPRDEVPDGSATIAITVDRYEVVIAAGDTVIAEGVVTSELAAEGARGRGGYRESRSCRVLRPGSSGTVKITGVGASKPKRRSVGGGLAVQTSPSRSTLGRAKLGVAALVGFVAAVAWILLGR